VHPDDEEISPVLGLHIQTWQITTHRSLILQHQHDTMQNIQQ